MSRIWLVTGCSTGFGYEIARAARACGDTVIATARGNAEQRLEDLIRDGCEVVSLDVTASLDQLRATVKDIIERHGRIDVLVNNAGMVQQGAIEETTADETYKQFNVNLFGLLNLTRLVLPHMRTQKSGTIVNIGSRGGRYGIPNVGLYNATKFALEGVTEALAAEVAPFDIKVICIEPGDFRTAVFESTNTGLPANPIAAYDYLRERFGNISGTQPGDPVKGAQAIVKVVTGTRPIPIRLALGSDAVDRLREVYEDALKNLKDWEEISRSTDYEAATS